MRSLLRRKKPELPPEEPIQAEVPALRDADVAAVYYGQRQGGDFYDFVRVSEDRVLFGLLDVAGAFDGTRAITSAAQETFRSLGTRLFGVPDVNEANAMSELCLELNRTVMQAAQGVRSCPAFVGCYNESLGIICYFNAGHTPGLVRDGNGIAELAATGLPLGLFSHATCEAPMVALEPSAALLLVSRGIIEGKRRGQEFGLSGVKEGLGRGNTKSAKEICLNTLDGVRQFMGTAPTHNDVTSLALVRANGTNSGGPTS
jgi:sigma-B regulation protein RsbU (phosphoserine phosphatase)